MRAVILAGGKGVRLRPFTTLIPKPLVPLGGKYAILEVIVMQLKKSGFTCVTMAVSHLSHLIETYFGDGSRYGLEINYSHEDQELSTIGPLTLIEGLPENFLVLNGDILCDLDYRAFYEKHVDSCCRVSVSSFKRHSKIDFGVLEYDEDGELTHFEEKPSYDFDVSMGVYCINRKVIESLDKGAPYGFDDLMLDSLKNKKAVNIRPFSGMWYDIGRPDDYENVDQNFDSIAEQLGI